MPNGWKAFTAGKPRLRRFSPTAAQRPRSAVGKNFPRKSGCIWVDMGGGTGANIENLARPVSNVPKQSLRRRPVAIAAESRRGSIQIDGWNNVETVEADATRFRPPEGQADVVTFSYSLTMIPDWFAAIENACQCLNPAVSSAWSIFMSRGKYPPDGLKRHRWFTRTIWPPWFSTDNVFPSPDHLPFLRYHLNRSSWSKVETGFPMSR